MKKLIFVLTIIALIAVLMMAVPAAGNNEGFTKVNKSFSIGSDEGYRIPEGSVVRHLSNGTTQVSRPDGSLVLKTKNSEVPMVSTPSGPKKATHVFGVPNGSWIKEVDDKTTKVYSDNRLILTTIDEEKNLSIPMPFTTGWIEYGLNDRDSGIAADYSLAFWRVPSSPPDPHEDTYVFVFNGLSPYPNYETAIMQPVLEWNRWGSPSWTGTAWIVGGTETPFYSTTHVPVSVGTEICGEIGYEYWNAEIHYRWLVSFMDFDEQSSSLKWSGTEINPNSVRATWVLEAYRYVDGEKTIDDMTDDDICGDISFYEIYLSRNGNRTYFDSDEIIKWDTWSGKLTDLDVDWSGITGVTLSTAN